MAVAGLCDKNWGRSELGARRQRAASSVVEGDEKLPKTALVCRSGPSRRSLAAEANVVVSFEQMLFVYIAPFQGGGAGFPVVHRATFLLLPLIPSHNRQIACVRPDHSRLPPPPPYSLCRAVYIDYTQSKETRECMAPIAHPCLRTSRVALVLSPA
jgi:hypothetical protein